MKVLYIHGYGGSPYGNSYQLFKEAFSDGVELLTIDYDVNKPVETLVDIRDYVETNHIDLVIASSLGGFFAMNLCGVSRIVVNPCWNPVVELPLIGFDGDIDGYDVLYRRMLESLDEEERVLCSGCFAPNDELLGTKYVDKFKSFFQRTYTIPGGHKLTKEAVELIVNEIINDHETQATEEVRKIIGADNLPWLDNL